MLRADAKAAPTLPRASATRCSIVDKLPHLLSTIRCDSTHWPARAYGKETERKKNPRASSTSDFLLTKGGVICQQYGPASFGNHRAASHLVGKWARICKIFLFGAGLSGVNPRSPDACSARPGLLQIGDSIDGALWIASTPRGTPNGNILHIRAEKTATCRRETQKRRPSQKSRRREDKRAPNSRHTDPQGGVCRQGSSRTATLWIS